jgi:hypothetical protein
MERTDAAPFRGPIGVVQEQAAPIGGGGEEGVSYPPPPPSSRLPLVCIEEGRGRRKTSWGRPGRKMRGDRVPAFFWGGWVVVWEESGRRSGTHEKIDNRHEGGPGRRMHRIDGQQCRWGARLPADSPACPFQRILVASQ